MFHLKLWGEYQLDDNVENISGDCQIILSQQRRYSSSFSVKVPQAVSAKVSIYHLLFISLVIYDLHLPLSL